MPKFSIITPVHLWNQDRVDKFLQTIKSVESQIFKDFEWIVVDDGSTLEFNWNIITENKHIPQVVLIQKPHEERVIACSQAFKVATGEWWLFLDSDDELTSSALLVLNDHIKERNRNLIFNWGCMYQHKDGTTRFRDPFQPKKHSKGHEIFGGGNIVNGTFAWHRSVYQRLGGFPDDVIENIDCSEINYGIEQPRDLFMGTPYDFSAAAQMEFPEIREFFMVDHEAEPHKIIKELGNPCRQDYYLFYKYTRKYHSFPIMQYFLTVHPK